MHIRPQKAVEASKAENCVAAVQRCGWPHYQGFQSQLQRILVNDASHTGGCRAKTDEGGRRDKENQKDGNYLLGLIPKSRCFI